MTWPTKTAVENYNEGATRLQRRFAYWPVRIDGFYVWMQFYEVYQIWEVKRYKIDDKYTAIVAAWIDLSKRIIK
jgi:hypothetical protein